MDERSDQGGNFGLYFYRWGVDLRFLHKMFRLTTFTGLE